MASTEETAMRWFILHTIPQEIFDKIYELTFTVPEMEDITMIAFQPPSVLQVNLAHRAALGGKYYGTNTFIARDDGEAESWCQMIGYKQKAMMTRDHAHFAYIIHHLHDDDLLSQFRYISNIYVTRPSTWTNLLQIGRAFRSSIR